MKLMKRTRIERAFRDPSVWTGLSGYPYTGAAVAQHAEAAVALLERGEDWTAQELAGSDRPTMCRALALATKAGDGDTDTQTIVLRCLGLVLEVHLGTDYADPRMWSEHRLTSPSAVVDALRTTAALTRAHGPIPAITAG